MGDIRLIMQFNKTVPLTYKEKRTDFKQPKDKKEEKEDLSNKLFRNEFIDKSMIGQTGEMSFEEKGFWLEGDCLYFSHRIKAKKNFDIQKAIEFLACS